MLAWGELEPRTDDTAGVRAQGGSATTSVAPDGVGGAPNDVRGGGGTHRAVGGGGGGPAPSIPFEDLFDRPDGPEVGNGWVEKNAAAFGLVGGRAVKRLTTLSYRDNLVYRPLSEAVRDVAVSVEFDIRGEVRFPQIFARVQGDTIDDVGAYDGYLLYVAGDANSAVLGRQRGTPFVVALETLALAASLTTGEGYRLRLSATGTAPVQLHAAVDQRVGRAWTTLATVNHEDGSDARIATPGTVGFSGDEPATYSYERFRYEALP